LATSITDGCLSPLQLANRGSSSTFSVCQWCMKRVSLLACGVPCCPMFAPLLWSRIKVRPDCNHQSTPQVNDQNSTIRISGYDPTNCGLACRILKSLPDPEITIRPLNAHRTLQSIKLLVDINERAKSWNRKAKDTFHAILTCSCEHSHDPAVSAYMYLALIV
jgi:hypothetical protein